MNNLNGRSEPITHPQKGVWYTEKIYPGTSLYNIGGSIRIKGNVDLRLLEESINILIKKHDGLRLLFVEEQGELKQYVSSYRRVKLDILDFSRYENPEEQFEQWIEKEARKPFVLENGQIFYFALFRISDSDNGYLAKFHHLISDGWSTNIMTEQVCDNYRRLFNGEAIDDHVEPSYIEYAWSEKQYLLSTRFFKDKAFWNEKFSNLSGISFSKSSANLEGRRRRFELGSELSAQIKAFAEKNKYSLNTLFVALYLVYVYKTTQQEDLVIGTPVLNRSGKKEKSMFGMFTSTMPFRFAIDAEANMLETFARVNESLKACYFHQKYPYDLLIQDLELKKRGYDTLFTSCINYYNTRLNSTLNGFAVENTEFYNGNQVYSLQLIIKDWLDSGSLTLDFDYKVNDYTQEQIEDMYVQLVNLINVAIRTPSEKIKKVSLLSEEERSKLIYQFNATEAAYPQDKSVSTLFEEQAKRTPEKIAISFNNDELTYQELNEKVNQLARYLVDKGVKPETLVGLLTTRSIETVIGILGILKAGGAYLPIEPGYPDDRIGYMLEDSGSEILLTNMALTNTISPGCQVIDLHNQSISLKDSSNLASVNKPDDLAYVIYTSGSTGKPKGAMIEHRGLANYIWWAKKMYVSNEDEVFPLYSSLAFDLTVTSLFTPLLSGGQIVVYNDDDSDHVLYRILKEKKATVVKLTPSHLSLLKYLNNRDSSVKKFIVGGEDLKVNLAKDIYESFGRNIEIFNEYGPTETAVGCMIYKYDYERDTGISVPIGIPADNVQCYLLDKHLNPVPPYSIGELYISGDGVAKGYLKNFELTQEKFIDNPFIRGKRMYKTGDLVRFVSGNKLEYVGRTDQQVKIRGYRIEPGEIEKYILSHEAIKNVAVIDFDDRSGTKHLCAYIVKKADISVSRLKEFLLRYIPEYMVPAYFVSLNEIPLTINGKINRDLLLPPQIEIIEETEFLSYRDEREEKLIETFCDVFNMQRVSIRQNFYHLGGDSIKAMQIATKLSNLGLRIKVKDILSFPVIEEMALCITQSRVLATDQGPCEGTIRPTPIVSWFFSQRFAHPNYYTQSILLDLLQDIEIQQLEKVLNELIRHHDSLRINYNSQTNELFYNNDHLHEYFSIQEHELDGLPYALQSDKMTFIAENMKSSFNIENGILIKACVFNLGQHMKRLLITAHHLVVDGVSWRIIVDDMHTLLAQIVGKQEIVLPAKTSSYQEWATILENYSQGELQEEDYWQPIVRKNFRFPTDYDLGEDSVFSSHTIVEQISEDLTEKLARQANIPYNTETKDLLITSLLRTIKEVTGEEDIVIELEGHGREEFENLDLSRTVGWFTNVYPFSVNLRKNDAANQIKEVKEALRKIQKKHISFGLLKHSLKSLDDTGKRYMRFNYLGDFNGGAAANAFQLLDNRPGSDSDKENALTCLVDINCFMLSGKLHILLTYSKNKFLEHTMKGFMNKFVYDLQFLIDHCCGANSVQFTPSDFDTVDLSLEELERFFQ